MRLLLQAESGPDEAALQPMLQLWDRHHGDVRAIFSELAESPRKALKYPPKDRADFASKYLAGGYTCINTTGSTASAESKDSRK